MSNLKVYQALPLSHKIILTEKRIEEFSLWVKALEAKLAVVCQ